MLVELAKRLSEPHRREQEMRRHLITAAIVVLGLSLASATAFAAKGGKGGHTSSGSSAAWVSADPNPAVSGQQVELSGCGYAFKPVEVTVTSDTGATQMFWVGMWANGCMDTAYFTAGQSGGYTIQVWQANSPKLDLMASTSLTVS